MTTPIEQTRTHMDPWIFLILIGLFGVPMLIRQPILGGNIGQINWLAGIAAVAIIGKQLHHGRFAQGTWWLIGIAGVLVALFLLSELSAHRASKGILRVAIGLLLPLVVSYYQPVNFDVTLAKVVKVFEVVSVVITGFGLIDVASGQHLMAQLFGLIGDDYYQLLALEGNRLYSLIGHPLYNAEIFLMTYALMFIQAHRQKRPLNWGLMVFLLAGIVMTASKSAIVIYLAMIFVTNIKRVQILIAAFMVLVIGYQIGVFDAILVRFATSLTTGRGEVWDRIKDSGVHWFYWFTGHGSDSKYAFDNVDLWARAAFEYPIRLYALEFGLVTMGILMGLIFIVPLIKMWQVKPHQWSTVLLYIAVASHVNMYNGIGTYSDALYLFALFTCMLLNVVHHPNESQVTT